LVNQEVSMPGIRAGGGFREGGLLDISESKCGPVFGLHYVGAAFDVASTLDFSDLKQLL
jgi:hypothetical protein